MLTVWVPVFVKTVNQTGTLQVFKSRFFAVEKVRQRK
jgi:hypothetical protein